MVSTHPVHRVTFTMNVKMDKELSGLAVRMKPG